ncbi:hypothetical protein RND81_01G165800 [Saponaria officinalis]|uniref:Uncharacterized protein n=1 Tax=Saponaria officinalis TaxID=3572 RepID=A0AAW1NJ86_SAPOF
MGTCISKCNPKKNSQKTHKNVTKTQNECKCQCNEQNNTNLVQDKIVISQMPISSPSKISSSYSNSNYPTSNSSSSSCSLVSSASSLVSYSSKSTVNSKLGSSVNENPRLIRPDYLPIKVNNSKRSSLPIKSHISVKNPNGPSPQKLTRPLAQKRPRSSSPGNITRQKSFRLESEPESESNKLVPINGTYSRPISPSPSRRFTRETTIGQSRNFTNSMRRENCYVKPPSPRRINGGSRRYNRSNNNNNNNNNSSSNNNINNNNNSNNLMIKNEEGMKMVNSKIQELAIGGLSTQDIDMMPLEDAQNPHIALDCFIFL